MIDLEELSPLKKADSISKKIPFSYLGFFQCSQEISYESIEVIRIGILILEVYVREHQSRRFILWVIEIEEKKITGPINECNEVERILQ